MSAIILDLDNCISDDAWRIRYINWSEENPLRRYHDYHLLAGFDRVGNQELFINTPHNIIVLTARPLMYRAITEEWLRRARIVPAVLMMRDNDDHQHSRDLKRQQLKFVMERYSVPAEAIACAYDDRPDVIDMYRELGVAAEVRFIHDQCAYTNPNQRSQNGQTTKA
jgi:hypothetical protein